MGGIAGSEGAQKFQELLTGSRGKAVRGVSDDVGMNAFGKVETNSNSARVGVGIVVGNHRNTSRIGEANRHRGRLAVHVGRPGEGGRGGRRLERSSEHGALGMGRAEARMLTENGVE